MGVVKMIYRKFKNEWLVFRLNDFTMTVFHWFNDNLNLFLLYFSRYFFVITSITFLKISLQSE